MPSWSRLVAEFDAKAANPDGDAMAWLLGELTNQLNAIRAIREDRNVLVYASAFMQKPEAPQRLTSITPEDVNGLMSVLYGMDYTKGLSLMLHTPGGVTTAAESFVAYMRSKFHDVEVIVPTYCMSAGTMIATGCERIWMGRQSQLGPVDPQMPMPSTGRFVSAQAIVAQFEKATEDIKTDPDMSLVYAPVLQSLGPALVEEARTSVKYSANTVAEWMARHMFDGDPEAHDKASRIAKFLNDRDEHLDHGRRIDRATARDQGLVVFDLEDDQALQEAVLTAYHLVTILFERTVFAKIMFSHMKESWIKGWGAPAGP